MIAWLKRKLSVGLSSLRRWCSSFGYRARYSTSQNLAAIRWHLRMPVWMRALPDSLCRIAASAIRLLHGLFVYLPGYVWRHRIHRKLVLGLPAVAALCGVLAWASLHQRVDRGQFLERCEREGRLAADAGNWNEAYLRYQRVISSSSAQPAAIFGLARSLEALGQTTRAGELFDAVATENVLGYPPALIRKATSILDRGSPDLSALLSAESLLKRALANQPENPDCHAALARFYLRIGDRATARHHLLSAVNAYPEFALPLARLADEQRDPAATAHWSRLAIAEFQSRVDANPRDGLARHELAEALFYARRFANAMDILRTDPSARASQPARELAEKICSGWLDSLEANARSAHERLKILETGLEMAPDSGLLLQRLARTGQQSGELAFPARAAIERRLHNPSSAAAMNLALGIEAIKNGDHVGAKHHFEQCLNLDPKALIAANNLAWLLANGPKPDLPKALQVVNAAIKRYPDNAHLRDTRGLVLARMERWPEAVADLEFALPRIAPNRTSHLVLAQAYRAMKLPQLAESHDEQARQLKK